MNVISFIIYLFAVGLVSCEGDTNASVASPIGEILRSQKGNEEPKVPTTTPESIIPSNGSSRPSNVQQNSINLALWRWSDYGVIIIFGIMIIIASLLKIIFEQSFFHYIHLPESCLLILTGVILGFFGNFVVPNAFPDFTINLFFRILLPPIMLDSAYSLYERDFFNNLGSIIVFAVVGTIINSFAVGLILWGSSLAGAFHTEISSVNCLVFSSLIAEVDPVTVLAIFEEIGVNLELYFIVFGESLFNDGVTVVLYNTLIILSGPGETEGIQYFMAIISFFIVVLGGFSVGWILGLLSALFLRFTKEARNIEPIIIITMAYLAYIVAETLQWSGIISLIACGVCQKRYAFVNISKKSYTTVKYGIKTLSAASDSIIFLFLGQVIAVATKNDSTQIQWDFDVGFILETLLMCLVIRYITVFGLSYLVNLTRIKKISLNEQFIVAYGGLRGAVSFSLAVLIPASNPHRNMFITTTIMVVFFTVFLQGGTIKLLVNKLGIAKKANEATLISTELNLQMIEHTIAGIDSIASTVSQSSIIKALIRFDEKYIKRFLIRDGALHNLTARFEKIALNEHFARLYGPNVLYKNCDKLERMSTGGENGNSAVRRSIAYGGRRGTMESMTPSEDYHNLLEGIRATNFQHYRKFNDDYQTDLHCVAEQLRRRSVAARRISECLDHPSSLHQFTPVNDDLNESDDEISENEEATHEDSPAVLSVNSSNSRLNSIRSISKKQRSNSRRYSLSPLTLNLSGSIIPEEGSTQRSMDKRRSTLDSHTIKDIYWELHKRKMTPK